MLESMPPVVISVSCILGKYISWYDFRILCHNKIETWVPDPCISAVSVLECVSTPPDKKCKCGSPVQKNMPARRASKFCARHLSECSDIFSLDLKSWRILGNIKPWPECQPEGSWLRSATSWNYVCPCPPLPRANFATCEMFISRGEYADALWLYRHPTTLQTPYDYTDTLWLCSNPTTIQTPNASPDTQNTSPGALNISSWTKMQVHAPQIQVQTFKIHVQAPKTQARAGI